MFFLFLHKNICYGYSLEVPRLGASNEYPQYLFLWRNKENIKWMPPLMWRYGHCSNVPGNIGSVFMADLLETKERKETTGEGDFVNKHT